MSTVTKRFDIVAGRKYDVRGETKTHWVNCGDAAQWDDGSISLRLNSVPVGNWFDGKLNLFEQKDKAVKGKQSAPANDSSDDSIPFN